MMSPNRFSARKKKINAIAKKLRVKNPPAIFIPDENHPEFAYVRPGYFELVTHILRKLKDEP